MRKALFGFVFMIVRNQIFEDDLGNIACLNINYSFCHIFSFYMGSHALVNI